MRRLIHLNGPPGIGKSTIAQRYVDDHPGTLNCDIDLLRRMVGGWQEDFASTGEPIRHAALAMITAYLTHAGDVTLPQMLADPAEVERFHATASEAGAECVHVVLMDSAAESVARFHRRGLDGDDPWHNQVRQIVADEGGDPVLLAYHDRLTELLHSNPAAIRLDSVDGDVEATYQALLARVPDEMAPNQAGMGPSRQGVSRT